jgi:spore coat protein U-like protein
MGILMPLLRTFIIVALLIAITSMGHAAPAKGNLAVSAYITGVGWCAVNSTQNVAFGTLNPLNPVNVQATGSISVRCLGFGSGFTVGVTQVTPSPLILTSGPNNIPYYLEVPTSATSSTGGLFVNLTIPIKADIQGINYKFAPAGSYTDTVTLQITP